MARAAQSDNEGLDLSIELVDPKVLRVCADPRNLPFSNEKGEGFENKLAELFAAKLQKKIDYMYFPQATGFVRMTLGAHRCDVIMGFPQGDDLVQGTNPYYRTAYALDFKAGLRSRRGHGAGRRASQGQAHRHRRRHAARHQHGGQRLDGECKALSVDDRHPRRFRRPEAMINDLNKGEIDAGVLWGPMAGFYAKKVQSAASRHAAGE